MSTSLHSPTDLRDQQHTKSPGTATHPTEQPETIRVTARPVRADGFGHRFPILFDHRDDFPAREFSHWGPGTRYMVRTFTTVLLLLLVAIIAIAWYLA